MPSLTDTRIKAFLRKRDTGKLFDSNGLYLLMGRTRRPAWRFRWRRDGKDRHLSLGVYPTTTLAQARAERDRMRGLLAAGQDPAAVRRIERQQAKLTDTTFGQIAEYRPCRTRLVSGAGPRPPRCVSAGTRPVPPELADGG